MILALASIIFNAFKLDFNQLLVGESQIAAISIIAALCVIILLSILLISYRIKEQQND
jgi:integral membrane sensor domain MASE1